MVRSFRRIMDRVLVMLRVSSRKERGATWRYERYAIASDIKIVFAESMADDAAAGTIGCHYTGHV